MYDLVNLNKHNIDKFKKLNDMRLEFNRLNKDFFLEYNNCNEIQKFLLRKKVRLLKNKDKYIGYIWIDNKLKSIYKINSIYVLNKDNLDDLIESYIKIITSIKSPYTLCFKCEKNNNNFNILKEIGFIKENNFIEMVLSIDKYLQNQIPEDISFKKVIRGYDEEKRCVLQNQIFYSDNRIPLEIEDIYYDEMQNYYWDDGAIFMKFKNKYIGYGQIITRDKCPYIVNFGLIDEYRNIGYGEIFLKYLLNIIYRKNKFIGKINVKIDNDHAINLYTKVGFKKYKEYANWTLKNNKKSLD